MSVLDGWWDGGGRDLRGISTLAANNVAELELERNWSTGNVLCFKVKSCVTRTYQR
jgi:hypothetical protein